jgi:hypothetical protein
MRPCLRAVVLCAGVTFVGVCGVATGGTPVRPGGVSNDVGDKMISLYEQRLAQAQNAVDSATAQKKFDDLELARVTQLAQQNAASQEELADKQRCADLAALAVTRSQIRLQEASLKLDLVRLDPTLGSLVGE